VQCPGSGLWHALAPDNVAASDCSGRYFWVNQVAKLRQRTKSAAGFHPDPLGRM